MSSSKQESYTARADVLWGLWDVPDNPLEPFPHYVIGGTMAEARQWAFSQPDNHAPHMKYIPVATIPVGTHGGTLWVVGTARHSPQWDIVLKIAPAAGMRVREG